MTRLRVHTQRPATAAPHAGAARAVSRDVGKSPDSTPIFPDQMTREAVSQHTDVPVPSENHGPRGRALDLRSGKVTPPPRMPSWFPPGFDLDAAARGARGILIAQGVPPSTFDHHAEHLVLSDADFTLLKTTTPIFLTRTSTGERLTDPATGRALELRETPGRNLTALLQDVKTRLPTVDLEEYTCDFTALGSADELLKQQPIQQALDVLKQGNRDQSSREYVVTARSGAEVVPGIKQVLGNQGALLDGVLTVNNAEQARALGIPDSVPTEGKKALAMAALLKLNGPADASVRSVKFMDDSDANLVAAMAVLPRLFPDVDFEFIDVVHHGGGRFQLDVVARSGTQGQLVDAGGHMLSAAQVHGYRSHDRAWSGDG